MSAHAADDTLIGASATRRQGLMRLGGVLALGIPKRGQPERSRQEVKNCHLDHSPHALRHSFRNFCAGAKISTVHSRLLMNTPSVLTRIKAT